MKHHQPVKQEKTEPGEASLQSSFAQQNEDENKSGSNGRSKAPHCLLLVTLYIPHMYQIKTAFALSVRAIFVSMDTFCSERLMERLNLKGKKTKIHLRTMGNNSTVTSCIVKRLEVSEHAGKKFFELPTTFTQKEMPVSTANIITEEELSKWSYLKSVQIPCIDTDVDLLIGTNASKLMEPWEVINNQEEGPYIVRTLLGWVINRPLRVDSSVQCGSDHPAVTVNRYNQDFSER